MSAYYARPLLYAEVVEQIKEKIASGEWAYGDRIPSESDLADLFHVSRATLREGISFLVNKGVLIRKRGIGTFVGQKEEFQGGIETLLSITQWISSHGYEPGTQHIHYFQRPGSVVEKDIFPERTGEAVAELHRVRTANGVPIIYCIDVIPKQYMPTNPDQFGESLMEYLENHWGQTVLLAHSAIEVVMATREIAERLGLTQGAPLLKLKQIHYNSVMEPILVSQDHFVPERFKFEIVRRRP